MKTFIKTALATALIATSMTAMAGEKLVKIEVIEVPNHHLDPSAIGYNTEAVSIANVVLNNASNVTEYGFEVVTQEGKLSIEDNTHGFSLDLLIQETTSNYADISLDYTFTLDSGLGEVVESNVVRASTGSSAVHQFWMSDLDEDGNKFEKEVFVIFNTSDI